MTYVIEGKLTREEKPEKYMNQFIDFKLINDIRGGLTTTKKSYVSTTSERFANWLNKKGHNLEWNDDLEKATEMCGVQEYDIEQTKFLKPLNNWADYLTQKFGESEVEKTIEGELRLWEGTRLPTPWLYATSSSKLKDIYVFNTNDQFMIEPNATHEGNKFTYGVILDTKFLSLSAYKTKTQVKSRRYKR
jgi:hypothetical protein